MKRNLLVLAISLGTLMSSTFGYAASVAQDASNRLKSAAAVLEEIANDPSKGIPQEEFVRAKCVVVVPGLVKAGLLVGGKYGHGVAVCRTRNDETPAERAKQAANARWSAPAFITIGGGSIGLQIGAEGTDLVMLVMNDKGMQQLLSSKFEFSVEGSAAAGTASGSTTVGSNPNLNTELLVYSRSKGAFVGQTLEGAVIEEDSDATKAVYGSDVPFNKILEGQIASPPGAKPLLRAVAELSHEAGKAQAR
jgi:lipid-binding SYLF domain-containing protein